MNFLSALFLPLLAVTALLCGRVPSRYRWFPLLAASCFFYISGEGTRSLLLGGTILLTWLCALEIDKARSPILRRLLLVLSLTGCFGSLFAYKYFGFALSLLGAERSSGAALPVGISFFTFQTAAYVIDVYRGRTRSERHPGLYALFVCFFPQLVAGPIERSGDLLPQLRHPSPVTQEDRRVGFMLMLRGYVKKLLLADTAACFVDAVYAAPAAAPAPAALMAMLLFALQIYGDFAGYSDIALGTARLFGIRLTENFRAPYLACTLRDFWRRWHITLNRWLTDYVYLPLGGSKKGKLRTAVNTMLVFLLSGLWHGAGWHYLLWGGLHGGALCAERMLLPHTPVGKASRALRTALTFGFVCFAWTFFRAASITDALTLLGQLVRGPWADGTLLPDPLSLLRLCAAAAVTWRMDLALPDSSKHAPAIGLLLAACVWTLLAQAATGTENVFIYFRF